MEGNQQKMREALDTALRFIGNLEIEPYSPLDEAASELRQRVMDALSTPPRNCDVGTPEEQYRRFWDMCSNKDVNKCAYCEFRRIFNRNCSRDKCFARWAQTPYAEEGAGK